MSKQEVRYAVGQIAFLMKGPGGETLCIPERHFGKPCVIVERGVIRMLSDGSEWMQSSLLHRMLAFPLVGGDVMCSGVCRTVVGIDRDDMDVDNVPQPLRLSGGRQQWPIFDNVSLVSEEHDPDIALLPEKDVESSAPLVFKVGDKVQTSDGEVGEVCGVDEDDPSLPYAVRASDRVPRWYHEAALTPYEVPQKYMLTVEFDSADDLAIAQGILGNLYVHGALDEADFPVLTRVIERLRTAKGDSAPARVAYVGIGCAPIHVVAGYHEHDGKLCEKT